MTLIMPQLNSRDPKEGIDFEYVESDTNALTIRILRADFGGVVYQYDYVTLSGLVQKDEPDDDFFDKDAAFNMVEDEDESEPRLKFDFTVLQNPGQYDTRHNPEFEFLIGDILSFILLDASTNTETKYSMFSKSDEGKIEKMLPPKPGTKSVNESTSFFARLWNWVKSLFS